MSTYKNPFLLDNQWSENECGDPFIMRFNGAYYLYCSSAGNYIKCWISENLVDFQYVGSVCDDPLISGAYAPEVCYYKGRFYMITSPIGSGHYLLESDKPTGPFHLISDNYGLLIDGSFFIDDDGKQFMLRAGHKGIVLHPMPDSNEINVNGATIPASYLNHWTEGPMMIKRNGYYYLTYTGNHLHSKGYRLAYSISKSMEESGFVNLKNRTFLIETGMEFHAIGHSSSFLAPDLDSYCIAYHTIDLDVKPRKRSMNIDRLFFNGARMYSNPIWWEQTAHRMPDFYSRGTKDLISVSFQGKDYWVTPDWTQSTYTAEMNIVTKGKDISFLYGLKNDQCGRIILNEKGDYQIQEGITQVAAGKFNSAISFVGNITIRLTMKSNSWMDIYINNMHLCEYQSTLGEGNIGVEKQSKQEIGFIGYSSVSEGNEDKHSDKAIPGRFDAVHCRECIQKRVFLDAGMEIYSGSFEKGQEYTYSINVKQTGTYKVVARVLSNSKIIKLTACINRKETFLIGSVSGIYDEEGYEILSLGNIRLSKGIQEIVITSMDEENLTIDYFELVEYAEVEQCIVVKEGALSTDRLQILGHKGVKSMIHKYSGFTCAENEGIAFIGQAGMSNYKINAIINRNNRNTGDASIFVRVTKESWFQAQVKEALFGYRIRVTAEEIQLCRNAYDEVLLVSYSLLNKNTSKLNIIVEVQENIIVIRLNNSEIITYVDPNAYLYGKVGMEATGEGFGFEHFSIYD